jgi:hypothetical protein
MNDPQPVSPRRRLQELLAVPERQRTDEQWDELIELEIMLAPGNREGAPDPNQRRNGVMQGGQPKPGGNPQGKKPPRRFHKRPPRGGPR